MKGEKHQDDHIEIITKIVQLMGRAVYLYIYTTVMSVYIIASGDV